MEALSQLLRFSQYSCNQSEGTVLPLAICKHGNTDYVLAHTRFLYTSSHAPPLTTGKHLRAFSLCVDLFRSISANGSELSKFEIREFGDLGSNEMLQYPNLFEKKNRKKTSRKSNHVKTSPLLTIISGQK